MSKDETALPLWKFHDSILTRLNRTKRTNFKFIQLFFRLITNSKPVSGYEIEYSSHPSMLPINHS